MFNLQFRPKIFYFGREIIRYNWNSINRGPLTRAGNYVRMLARQSIRRQTTRPFKSSPKGRPPYSHVAARTPPFKMIYSVPINFGTGVIVGMVGFNAADPVPGLHEHGMSARRRIAVFKLRQTRAGQYPKGRRQLNRFGQRIIYKQKPQEVSIMARYPKRPFMGPALDRAWPKLPPMWANSIRKSA